MTIEFDGQNNKLGTTTADSVTIKTNDTDALTVDSSQRIGIGTSSPNFKLDIEGSSDVYAELKTTTTTSETGLYFSDSANTARGKVVYDHNNDSMYFDTLSSERMRIDSSGNLQFNSGYGSVATAYGCRAWVNFNGTGTVAIRDSGNVSSITDNATGDYTVNFTTALTDANYSVVGTCLGGSSSGSNYMIFGGKNANTSNPQTTSAVTITIAYVASVSGSGGLLDHDVINVAIFR